MPYNEPEGDNEVRVVKMLVHLGQSNEYSQWVHVGQSKNYPKMCLFRGLCPKYSSCFAYRLQIPHYNRNWEKMLLAWGLEQLLADNSSFLTNEILNHLVKKRKIFFRGLPAQISEEIERSSWWDDKDSSTCN